MINVDIISLCGSCHNKSTTISVTDDPGAGQNAKSASIQGMAASWIKICNFDGCTYLQQIVIPESVVVISESVLKDAMILLFLV